jgi:hypothetical protein
MASKETPRPRWGTFSVVDHRDLVSLTPEVLLYDKLVFPVPTDDDWERWAGKKWKPELQKKRLGELGDLVHRVVWTEELRKKWSDSRQLPKFIKREVAGLAMASTEIVLAHSVLKDLAHSVLIDHVPPPFVIAAYQHSEMAKKALGLTEGVGAHQKEKAELHRQVCALFERRLAMPLLDNPEAAFQKAIELAHDTEYQQARRSLFEWEDKCVTSGWPSPAAIEELEKLIKEHDKLIKKFFVHTIIRKVFYVVELGTSELAKYFTKVSVIQAGAGEAVAEGAGVAAGEGVKGILSCVKARCPSIEVAPEDPLKSPAAAPYLAMKAMYHDPVFKG